eukprot:3780737-Pyramimonas_sp.AAC.1
MKKLMKRALVIMSYLSYSRVCFAAGGVHRRGHRANLPAGGGRTPRVGPQHSAGQGAYSVHRGGRQVRAQSTEVVDTCVLCLQKW